MRPGDMTPFSPSCCFFWRRCTVSVRERGMVGAGVVGIRTWMCTLGFVGVGGG